MKAAVFDTYVTKKDGSVMHFDIITKEGESFDKVVEYGQEYLKSKDQEGQELGTEECTFCHIEEATAEMELSIVNTGYFILEMQGCGV